MNLFTKLFSGNRQNGYLRQNTQIQGQYNDKTIYWQWLYPSDLKFILNIKKQQCR